MSEQPAIGNWIFLPPDFTGTIASPVMINERGKPVRRVTEFVDGKYTTSYDVKIRRAR